jgi:hypothetical protein
MNITYTGSYAEHDVRVHIINAYKPYCDHETI